MASPPPVGLLFAEPVQQPLSAAGKTQPGCYRYLYYTKSTTQAPVYADGYLQFTVTQPVTANGNGQFVPVYLDPNIQYREQLFSSDGRLLEDNDPVVALPPGVVPASWNYNAVSQSATSVTSSVTLAIDPNLQIRVPGPGTYYWDAGLEYVTAGSSGATPGLKLAAVFKGGMRDFFTSSYVAFGNVNGGYANASALNGTGAGFAGIIAAGGVNYSLTGGSVKNYLCLRGGFRATESGVLAIYWAQQTSSATATTLNAGSFLRI